MSLDQNLLVTPAGNRPGHPHTEEKGRMSRSFPCICLLLLVALSALVLPVSGYTTLDSITAAGRVYVSNVTIDPGVLFTGDEATVTFAVTNGNPNSTSSTTDGVMIVAPVMLSERRSLNSSACA